MDLLQRFRPATYWAVLAKRIGKTGAEGEVSLTSRSLPVPCEESEDLGVRQRSDARHRDANREMVGTALARLCH